ncbi:MAG: hypothetical protein QOH28_1314 [Actinomycetota bacterium]|nr:hypothetical protein [Actinomycetota bacterium]
MLPEPSTPTAYMRWRTCSVPPFRSALPSPRPASIDGQRPRRRAHLARQVQREASAGTGSPPARWSRSRAPLSGGARVSWVQSEVFHELVEHGFGEPFDKFFRFEY